MFTFAETTMSTISIRQATLADLDAVVPLFDAYRQFYGRASDVEAARTFLQARFQHGESIVLLARDGDAAVGFTQLYPSFSSVSLARIFVLNDLFIHPPARKRGVATELLAAAAEYARSQGAIRLTLSTATTNVAAQAVYEAAGWQRDAEFYVYHFTV